MMHMSSRQTAETAAETEHTQRAQNIGISEFSEFHANFRHHHFPAMASTAFLVNAAFGAAGAFGLSQVALKVTSYFPLLPQSPTQLVCF
jgi:hypothetical protein